MDTLNQKKLETLRSLREKVNWNIEEERRDLLHQLYPLVKDWTEQLPNLRDIFRRAEIDWLLTESLKSARFDTYRTELIPLVQFVARTSYKDEPEIDVSGKPSSSRTTPLHHTFEDYLILGNYPKLIDHLFQIYDRFDVNYTDESGLTHFHVACFFGCDEFVEKFLELGQDPNILEPKTSDTPLHLALIHRHKKTTELLLKYGANPNLANVWDVTPLHYVCKGGHDNADLAEILFEMSDEKQQPIQVNAQNKLGWTPLHYALFYGRAQFCRKGIVQVLLRRGADSNLANVEGSTPLHFICNNLHSNIDLAKLFFEINDERQQLVEVNARDNSGNAPLHLALKHSLKKLTELLLRRGANTNLANEKGSTPLHMICERKYYDPFDMVELFFKINDERKQTVEVNARDCCGRTPLQLAVANLKFRAVDLILNHGADLSLFVFPSESYLDQLLRQNRRCEVHLKLMLACLDVIENLEKKGYVPDRNVALTIMKLFAKYELFDRWAYNGIRWDHRIEFMIKPNLSLHDLIKLRPEDAEKRLTCKDYYEFYTNDFVSLLGWRREHCTCHLSEKVSRRFFRRWTLDYFLELTGYRLPILCCEMIIKQLMNQDLWNICSAVTGQIP